MAMTVASPRAFHTQHVDLTLAIANIYLDGPGSRPMIALHQARNTLHCVYSTQAGIRAVPSVVSRVQNIMHIIQCHSTTFEECRSKYPCSEWTEELICESIFERKVVVKCRVGAQDNFDLGACLFGGSMDVVEEGRE